MNADEHRELGKELDIVNTQGELGDLYNRDPSSIERAQVVGIERGEPDRRLVRLN